MKNNRRSRKLKFIRAKNAIRRGARVGFKFKMSNYFARNVESSALLENLKQNIEAGRKILEKKWKLSFHFLNLYSGLDEDDFLKDLFTIQIEFTRA